MTGITKLDASILWGNGFKLQDKEGNEWRIAYPDADLLHLVRDDGESWWVQKTFYNRIGTDYHIICHSLDKLTQPIMHEGKEIVPIVELANINTPEQVWMFKKNLGMECAWSKGIDEEWFDFEFGVFKTGCMYSCYTVDNQAALFAYMDSLHFDRFGWSERGLTTEIK